MRKTSPCFDNVRQCFLCFCISPRYFHHVFNQLYYPYLHILLIFFTNIAQHNTHTAHNIHKTQPHTAYSTHNTSARHITLHHSTSHFALVWCSLWWSWRLFPAKQTHLTIHSPHNTTQNPHTPISHAFLFFFWVFSVFSHAHTHTHMHTCH